MRSAAALAALAALLALAPPARAHQWWIEPSRFEAGHGGRDTLTVAAFAGQGFRGERKAFTLERVKRCVLVVDGAARAVPPSGVPGTDRFARLPVDSLGGGSAMLALETTFARIALPADEFDRYLADEGLDGPRAARARGRAGASRDPVRERYARCAKTWLRGRGDTPPPAGLTLELQPLSIDAALRPGQPLRVALLLRGRPLAGALVKAWRRDLDPRALAPLPADARDSVAVTSSARTDAAGVATLALDQAGEWLLSTVYMEPSEDPAEADWQSWWASLTFHREALEPVGAPSGR